MTGTEFVTAAARIRADADAVFAVLADPTEHAAIDGTGWVSEAVDDQPITHAGQVFRMAMYHPDHPDGSYEIRNRVLVLERPRAIAWQPGYLAAGSDELEFGGWTWRYDLTPMGTDGTEVVLTYDWSGVGPGPRAYLAFPPFADDHLDNSLVHLAEIVARRHSRR